jgi:dihydrofolate synthase/folylpolyglutamate synthase
MLFDVGHNPAALGALVDALDGWREAHPEQRVVALVTFLADKDSTAMLACLDGRIDYWLGMPLTTDRGRDRAGMEAMLQDVSPSEVVDGAESALERLVELSESGDLLVVFGSFYLVGDIMRAIGSNPYPDAGALGACGVAAATRTNQTH